MLNNKMNIACKVRLPKLVLFHGLLAIFVLLHCERTPTKPVPEIPFSGRALLENQTWHDGITIIRSLMTDSLLVRTDTTSTDSSGKYVFSKAKSPGDYLMTSYYPFFTRDTIHVKVIDKGIEAPIPDMQLRQRLRITVATDKTTYSLSDTIHTEIVVTNLGATDIVFPSQNLGFVSLLFPSNKPRLSYVYTPEVGIHYYEDCVRWNIIYHPGESRTIALIPKIVGHYWAGDDLSLIPGTYLHYVFAKCQVGEFGSHFVEPVNLTIIQ